ncbi:hypothetical protein [Stella sp.]|uniref:hypothetical protein n=1 Tax=Stella sp. TaxID=2912054 RepID=UPI0035AD801B
MIFDRHMLFTLVIGVAVVNGIFSPYLNIAVPITAVLMPEMFPRNPSWVLFFSSILVASATLLFAGVPAAILERLMDETPEATTPMWAWLALTVVLTLPALPNIAP